MWPVGSCGTILLDAVKRQWGTQVGPWTPQAAIGPDQTIITVAAVRTSAAIITGELAGRLVETMLNSGSAVSLVMRNEIITCGDKITTLTSLPPLKLITASGEPLPISGCVRLPVKINQLQVFIHNFIVVDRLVAPVILGLDFLTAT